MRSCSTTCAVPAENLIGEEGRGFAYAMGALDRSRPIVGAQALGIAQGALDARDGLRQGAQAVRPPHRRLPGPPVHARRHGDAGRGRAPARVPRLLRCSTTACPGPRRARRRWRSCFASDTAMRVTTDCVQLLGGVGYTKDFPVERFMRDAKITQIYEGTNQIQRVVIARRLLDEVTAPSAERANGAGPALERSMSTCRFSPAPTGSLHVGCARTALFNWLLRAPPRRHVHPAHRGHRRRRARARSGSSASRTRCAGSASTGTRARSSRATRFDEYRAAADAAARRRARVRVLLHRGRGQGAQRRGAKARAPARLRRSLPRPHRRAAARRRRRGPAALDPVPHPRRRARARSSTSSAARCRSSGRTISDFVIVRSDGSPIFFLANAVDDLEMGITHVIRGEDLIDSTHRVLALRDGARRADRPRYAHLPLHPRRRTGRKLSKRHGAVALEDFRDAGYLPEALVQLPRAARLGARRRSRGDDRRRDRRASSTSTGVTHVGRRLRPQEARLAERRVDPPAHPRRPRGPRARRSRASASATASTSRRCRGGGCDRAGARRRRSCRSSTRRTSSSSPTTTFGIADESGTKVAATERVDEILDAVDRARRDVRVDRRGHRPAARRSSSARRRSRARSMPLLYAAVEGRPRRAAAVRLDRAARPRAGAGAARAARAAGRRARTRTEALSH